MIVNCRNEFRVGEALEHFLLEQFRFGRAAISLAQKNVAGRRDDTGEHNRRVLLSLFDQIHSIDPVYKRVRPCAE